MLIKLEFDVEFFFCFQIFGDSDEEEAGESQGSGSKKPSYLDEIGKKVNRPIINSLMYMCIYISYIFLMTIKHDEQNLES